MALPTCTAGQVSTPQNPCSIDVDWGVLLQSLDFSTVIAGMLSIMAALAAVFIVMRGGSMVLNQISANSDTAAVHDPALTHGVEHEGRYWSANSYDDVIDGADYYYSDDEQLRLRDMDIHETD